MEIELTETSNNWFQEHHPPGIVWEYAPNKPFKLHIMVAEFVELAYLGIPYRISHTTDSKPTVKKAAS